MWMYYYLKILAFLYDLRLHDMRSTFNYKYVANKLVKHGTWKREPYLYRLHQFFEGEQNRGSVHL